MEVGHNDITRNQKQVSVLNKSKATNWNSTSRSRCTWSRIYQSCKMTCVCVSCNCLINLTQNKPTRRLKKENVICLCTRLSAVWSTTHFRKTHWSNVYYEAGKRLHKCSFVVYSLSSPSLLLENDKWSFAK